MNVKHIEHFLFKNVRMSLQDRINELFDEKHDATNADLARFVGCSRATVTDWRNGNTKNIAGANAYKVAEFFGPIEPKWVQTGIGKKLKHVTPEKLIEPNATTAGDFDLWDDETPLNYDEVALPFFREVEISAGAGRYEVMENNEGKLRFAKNTLRKHGVLQENAACVRVIGNSMEPVIPDGTTIGIDKGNTSIRNGDIYAIDHDGHLRVKMLYLLPGGVIRVRSYNIEEWPDEHYSGEDALKIRILGRVFWWSVLR